MCWNSNKIKKEFLHRRQTSTDSIFRRMCEYLLHFFFLFLSENRNSFIWKIGNVRTVACNASFETLFIAKLCVIEQLFLDNRLWTVYKSDGWIEEEEEVKTTILSHFALFKLLMIYKICYLSSSYYHFMIKKIVCVD